MCCFSPQYIPTNPDLSTQTLCVVSHKDKKLILTSNLNLSLVLKYKLFALFVSHKTAASETIAGIFQGWNASQIKTISSTRLNATRSRARRVAVELARPLRSLPVRFSVQLLHHKMGHPVFALQLIHVISNLNGGG